MACDVNVSLCRCSWVSVSDSTAPLHAPEHLAPWGHPRHRSHLSLSCKKHCNACQVQRKGSNPQDDQKHFSQLAKAPTSPLCSAKPGIGHVLTVICDGSVGIGGMQQQWPQQQQQRLQMLQAGQPAGEIQADQGAKGPLPWAQPAAAADHSNSSCLKPHPWEGPWKRQRSQATGSEGN